MFLDFHTHQIVKEAGAQNIYNVILSEETMQDQRWMKQEAVSVGIHPWYMAGNRLDEMLAFLQEVAVLPVVKCIGEAGLDALRGGDMAVQEMVFTRQIRIAEAVGKPVVIHCVRAFNELMAVAKNVRPDVPMIIHGFSRKPELARKLISAGFYLSFGKDLLNKPQVQEAFRETPAHRLFLETDDREDISIQEVYEKAAAIRGISIEELQEKIYQNYTTL